MFINCAQADIQYRALTNIGTNYTSLAEACTEIELSEEGDDADMDDDVDDEELVPVTVARSHASTSAVKQHWARLVCSSFNLPYFDLPLGNVHEFVSIAQGLKYLYRCLDLVLFTPAKDFEHKHFGKYNVRAVCMAYSK